LKTIPVNIQALRDHRDRAKIRAVEMIRLSKPGKITMHFTRCLTIFSVISVRSVVQGLSSDA